MGRIEDQIANRTKEYLSDLSWYIHAMNLLQAEHTRAVNDLNRAFNEKMAEYKNAYSNDRKKESGPVLQVSEENTGVSSGMQGLSGVEKRTTRNSTGNKRKQKGRSNRTTGGEQPKEQGEMEEE